MPEPLDSLDSLADHAVRQARLAPAADLRRRGDRRRTRRRIAGSALAVVAIASVAVGVSALGGDDRANEVPPAGTPTVVETTPTPSPEPPEPAGPLATPTDTPVLDGSRQLAFLPVGTSSVVSVAGAGDRAAYGDPLEAADELGPRAGFVPTPRSPGADQFALKTGSLLDGAETFCLDSDDFALAQCTFDDAAPRFFRLEPAGRTDGHATFRLVSTTGSPLDVGGDTFFVADTGPANVPLLD